MENEHTSEIEKKDALDIFKKDEVQEHFADLNIELLKGAHIDNEDHYLFSLLEKYYSELRIYYNTFYRLELERKSFENNKYYFLDFFIDSNGVLSPQKRNKKLTAIETITALTLLNMYYERQFEKYKKVSFLDIREKIEQGEHHVLYKKAFFKDSKRQNFKTQEWGIVFKNIKNVIQDFEQMRWVKEFTMINENDFSFVLKSSIHRFQLMYEHEIVNLEEFVDALHPNEGLRDVKTEEDE